MSKSALRLNSANPGKLRRALLGWYDQNRRELPWRRDADPYRVWVSEIMLQQTRVAAVLDHYARFMQRFPSVRALAAAREASVLAAWSGLGYYHRARRLHKAAKIIVRGHHGKLPRTAKEWRELPGIGPYTAAAIASIASGEAVALVDGNVERVLLRIFGHSKGSQAVWQRAEMLLDRQRPGDFNQAMMELGATVCTPRAPQCGKCPLGPWCKSRGAVTQRSQAPRKHRDLCYALVCKGRDVLLVQRPVTASLMAGMWELPAILGSQCNGNATLARLRHAITDTDYDVSVISVAHDSWQSLAKDARWLSRRQWERLPLTGLTRKVLQTVGVASSMNPAESNEGRNN
jgi:A/G-specific adenine glycosylase